ncbi:NAD(P)-dependent oxidoreductase [Anaerosinus massiliensis]|uniref:NAD(P)-dependent oxidoreductase n=1 Tax=Massilibacillus massiliensis TaxID=1806837 RepID=UPI000AD7997C|nr:NAD(P)-dependent oxidoreductase [Massilibacillus massiliensis]
MDDKTMEIYKAKGFTLKEAVAEAKRCLNCVKPTCRRGCPIENEIPAFIRELANGNLGQASAVIARRSNLPAVCGRVCPRERQCEGSCVLNADGRAIQIGKLERFIADMDGDLEITPLPKLWEEKGRVAVIGSGPAGLTVAGDLAKMGFKVAVFDAQSEPGGVLMYGIPAFRLSKSVVRREIQKIERLGVQFRTNVMVGQDLTLDDIFLQGFDAVFVGTGNSVAKNLNIEGKNLPGVVEATYLLQMVALVNQGSVDREEIPVRGGDRVVIIGAGNVAMDAARTAQRENAAQVTVVFRETENKIAALPSEVEVAKREGVIFTGLKSPIKFVGDTKVTGVQCEIREKQGDKVVGTGEFETIPADRVIIAIGQKPAARIIATTHGIEVNEGGFVRTKERPYGMTTRHGVFSGGDVVHGPATVVRAMKDAKKVALGIAQYVEAKKLMEECGLKIKE